MAPVFRPGLELSRRFYTEVVTVLLDQALTGTPYSAALLGWGCDVQGFDTERSPDHAWGPRLQVFLAGEDYHEHAAALDVLLERERPQPSTDTRCASRSRTRPRLATGYTS